MVISNTRSPHHAEHDAAHVPTLTEQSLSAGQNATQSACVPQIIAAQAALTPDAPALIAGNQALSYSALNQQANQLAHYLQSLGVGAETPVGLCMERSPEMVVGLLGILKAGGAYVPLDNTYPPARLKFMLDDASVPVLLTQQHLTEHLPTTQASIISLDNEPALARQSKENPAFPATPDNLVYIIYTSGSTGQPKGVQITHKSLLNLISWHQQAFSITAADRATQITSPAFDATGWELWPYLCCGASVYLVDEQLRTQVIPLRDWLVSSRITISFLPTTLAEQALALAWPPETALRYLLTGADTLHQYPDASLPFALVNNYGPTEATVVATSGRIPPNDQADTPPSIGRPIANADISILADDGNRQRSTSLGNCTSAGLAWLGAISTAQN